MSEFEEQSSKAVGTVIAVCRSAEPGLPKPVVDVVQIKADWGIEGDYHAGHTVRHRYLAKKDPSRPNLRQLCLLDAAAFPILAQQGIQIGPGMMGENITISGLALMHLPLGTRLAIGSVQLEITEVRVPCYQLNSIDPRLLKAVVVKEGKKKNFLAGIMARVLQGGPVRAGDQVVIADQTHC